MEFTFGIAGAPVVVMHLPSANAVDIAEKSHITIVFDRPMVPLTQVQGEASERRLENWNVTITPDIDGRWRWLSTVAIEFIPKGAFLPATRYTVHVPSGMKTVNGDATEQDFSWSFDTLRPAVIATDPAAESSLAGPGTEVSLTFNLPMDAKDATGRRPF